MRDLCVIGSGNMGKAMVKGVINAGLLPPSQIIVTDISEKRVRILEEELGIAGSCDNAAAVSDSRIVILAVKPQFYKGAVQSIRDYLMPETIVVSIAPGRTLEALGAEFKEGTKIVRAMPNTPAMVLEGMTAMCGNNFVTKEEITHLEMLFNGFGRTEIVPEGNP